MPVVVHFEAGYDFLVRVEEVRYVFTMLVVGVEIFCRVVRTTASNVLPGAPREWFIVAVNGRPITGDSAGASARNFLEAAQRESIEVGSLGASLSRAIGEDQPLRGRLLGATTRAKETMQGCTIAALTWWAPTEETGALISPLTAELIKSVERGGPGVCEVLDDHVLELIGK